MLSIRQPGQVCRDGRPANWYRVAGRLDTMTRVSSGVTTLEVQHWLDELGAADATERVEAIVRKLLTRSAERLQRLCASLLYRRYPRLARGPLNLSSHELLGAVVERLIKAMRGTRPPTVRDFFSLAHQHLRWELNDLARRLDDDGRALELDDRHPADRPPDPTGTRVPQGERLARILGAIEALPEEEREPFNLVRIGGMTQADAAELLGVSTKTIQRRLNRSLIRLSAELRDLLPTRVVHELR